MKFISSFRWVGIVAVLAAAAPAGWKMLVRGETVRAEDDSANPKSPLVLPASVRISRSSDFAPLGTSREEYTVAIRVVSGKLTFITPEINIRDGERVTLSDSSVHSIVLAKKTENGVVMPVTRDIPEGSVFELSACAADHDEVVLDVTATLQSITGKPDKAPRRVHVNTLKGRTIQRTRRGETVLAEFGKSDKWSVEIQVKGPAKGSAGD